MVGGVILVTGLSVQQSVVEENSLELESVTILPHNTEEQIVKGKLQKLELATYILVQVRE